jgi:hypothetical protein
MNRGPLAVMQHRKFRLLVRWKNAVKAATSFRLLPPAAFPHAVIFRAFEELVRLTRLAATGAPLDSGKSFLPLVHDDAGLSPDQYMDVFLVGREVLADFLASDASLVGKYSSEVRNGVRHALNDATRHLVDREMRGYAARRNRAARAAIPPPVPHPEETWAPVLREA